MNITIEIHYRAGAKASQHATFQLRGRKPERVAFEWWKQIKKDLSYHAQLEKVIVDGNNDITQLVKELEEQEWRNTVNDDLPF